MRPLDRWDHADRIAKLIVLALQAAEEVAKILYWYHR